MLSRALRQTWQQMLHPKFRSVFITAIIAATATLAGLTYGVYEFWPQEYTTGWDWVDSAGFSLIIAASWYIFFPAIATLVMGFLTDGIADAVEDEYYPHRKALRDVLLYDVFMGSLKLMALMVLINLLALIPYIFLFFTTGGIGTFALFIIVNGLLLGREYFEMVALRHMNSLEVAKMRKSRRDKIFPAGMMIAAFFAVPFVNILAPIIAAAVMTHVFHHLYED